MVALTGFGQACLNMPKGMKNNKTALSQEWVELWSYILHTVRHTNLFDLVHSDGCGQAHLGLPKVILQKSNNNKIISNINKKKSVIIIKSAIYHYWIELWCWLFAHS